MVFADTVAVLVGVLLGLFGLAILVSNKLAQKITGKSGLLRIFFGLAVFAVGTVSVLYFGGHLASRHALMKTLSNLSGEQVEKISFNLVQSTYKQPAKYIDKRPIELFIKALNNFKTEDETSLPTCDQNLHTYIYFHQQEQPLKLNLCLDIKQANLFIWQIEDETIGARRAMYSSKPLFTQARSIAMVLAQPAYNSSYGGLNYENRSVFRKHSSDVVPMKNRR